jgi:ribosomal protein S18 acetylase RimI-like enzyme
MSAAFAIRPAVPADAPALGRLAAQLVHYHHALDPDRYLLVERVEEGYARFLTSEMANPRAVVLCAVREDDGAVVGYTYGTVEGRDWNALLDRHGALHDILVDPGVRRAGLGARLLRATCERLEALGAPRVVLHTAVQNREAQALFAKAGFRATMIEMTRERPPSSSG